MVMFTSLPKSPPRNPLDKRFNVYERIGDKVFHKGVTYAPDLATANRKASYIFGITCFAKELTEA